MSATPAETDSWNPGVPADVLRRPARFAAERRSGADTALRHPHGAADRRDSLVPRSATGGAGGCSTSARAGAACAARRRQPHTLASVTDLATGRDVGDADRPPPRRRRRAPRRVAAAPGGRLPAERGGAGDSARLVDPVHGFVCVLDDRRARRDPTPAAADDGRPAVALLVGIDAYVAPINPLYGCRNDIAALSTTCTRAPRLRRSSMRDALRRRGDPRCRGRRVP